MKACLPPKEVAIYKEEFMGALATAVTLTHRGALTNSRRWVRQIPQPGEFGDRTKIEACSTKRNHDGYPILRRG